MYLSSVFHLVYATPTNKQILAPTLYTTRHISSPIVVVAPSVRPPPPMARVCVKYVHTHRRERPFLHERAQTPKRETSPHVYYTQITCVCVLYTHAMHTSNRTSIASCRVFSLYYRHRTHAQHNLQAEIDSSLAAKILHIIHALDVVLCHEYTYVDCYQKVNESPLSRQTF